MFIAGGSVWINQATYCLAKSGKLYAISILQNNLKALRKHKPENPNMKNEIILVSVVSKDNMNKAKAADMIPQTIP